ncbi:MAG TPA: RNA 2',3'-cyclic phosphodiesterase [Thermomicrobiales bacterium]|nr:RNA 2',3'-cyclic phosphodiesterase [Thermomicrobiales bacterium]
MSKRARRPPKIRPPSPDEIESPWRLFIALPLPVETKTQIAGIIEGLAGDNWPVRWVSPETGHLTLHFLGDTHPDRAELLRLALAEPIARHAPFALQTGGLGVFPNIQRPRVLWLGLEGQMQLLQSLHRDIGETLRRFEFPVEAGKLHPHITLGRVRENPPLDFPAAVERRFNELSSNRVTTSTEIPVNEVVLIRSFLGKGGPRHEPVARYPLK